MTLEILIRNPFKEIRSVTRFALPLMMAAFLLPTAAKAEMTADQKKEVEEMVHQYILEHGDVLIESVNKYQSKQEAEANKQFDGKAKDFLTNLKKEDTKAYGGNKDGAITVVEFFDYNCGYCKKAFEEIQNLVKDDKDVKIVLFDMPILGPSSHEISKWALAARNQDKYFAYHVALMKHNGEKDEGTLKQLAKDAGLDVDKLVKDKDDPKIEEDIKKHLDIAQSLGIQGTPGFLVGDKMFRGYIPYDAMQGAIKEQREKDGKKS